MGIVSKMYYPMNELAPHIEEALKNGQKVRLTVSGNSMFPLFLNRRDTVELTGISGADDIKKYDIVFYKRQNGQYVLHRVLHKHKSHLVIAGDGEIEKEYAVDAGQVMAKVTSFVRKGKYVAVQSKPYKIYVVLWCAVFPLRYFMLNIGILLRRIINGKHKRH